MARDQFGLSTEAESALDAVVAASSIEAAIHAGKEIASLAGAPKTLKEGIPFAVVPEGYKLQSLSEFQLKEPIRVEADPIFVDVAGFVAYVNRFHTENTVIFADRGNNCAVAVIDYHAPKGPPAWAEHRSRLTLQISPEWSEWNSLNRKDLDQETFANFLEDHIGQIGEPDAKVLMDAITKIKLVRTQSTKAVRNLTTGEVQLAFTDEETGGEGTTRVPTKLVLMLRYFRGQDAFKVSARLRYRPKGTGVAFSYIIDDLDRIKETTFSDVAEKLAADTGCPVYLGTP